MTSLHTAITAGPGANALACAAFQRGGAATRVDVVPPRAPPPPRLVLFSQQERINKWVEDQTNRRITNLLPARSITPATSVVLTNAIYFNGNWSHQFEPEATHSAVRRPSAEGSVAVGLSHTPARSPVCELACWCHAVRRSGRD